MLKTLSIAALIAASATASFAGSLANAPEPYVQEQPDAFVPAPGSGIGAPVIIGGVLAAAAIAYLISENSDSDTDTDPVE